jgi:hypothetical protein
MGKWCENMTNYFQKYRRYKFLVSFALSGLVVIFIFLTTVTGEAKGANLLVRSDRPRVLIDSDDLVRIKSGLSTHGFLDYAALRNYVMRRAANTPVEKLAQEVYDPKLVASVAFVGLVSNDIPLSRLAIDYALTMSRTPPDSGDDIAQRNRLLSMAYVYDWLYDRLSKKEKTLLLNGIISHVKYLVYFLNDPLYTGGHSRLGSAVIMAGLIALSEEDWPVERMKLLELVKQQWEQGYNPFQSYVAQEGGYHMGWRYGPAYTEPLAYLLWEKATGVRWGNDWRNEQIYWLIYGLRGDGTLPRSGDCWDSLLQDNIISSIVSTSAGLLKNRHAEWFYQKYFSKNWDPQRLWRLIFYDPSVAPLSPDNSEFPLPLSRNFHHSGFVISRDSWFENTTQLVFKCAPFYTRNHHHKDQNHIEISYKGSLLIDSGFYDAFGTSHWKNYYTRTIAHNTLVVPDPTERFLDTSTPVSNDGGQKYPGELELPVGREPIDLQETFLDKYRIGGIVGFGAAAGVTWMRGDASRAYSSQKLDNYERDILMVNRPEGFQRPFIIVIDRVNLAKYLKPTILFHSNEKPSLVGNRFKIANSGGGILFGTVSASAPLGMDLVGGEGKEWWVDGKNYPPQSNWEGRDIDVGSWRVEVATIEPVKKIEFITFLSVGNVKDSEIVPDPFFVSGEGYAGVIVGKGFYLMILQNKTEGEWHFEGTQFEQVQKIFVGGLSSGLWQRFVVNNCAFNPSEANIVFSKAPQNTPVLKSIRMN